MKPCQVHLCRQPATHYPVVMLFTRPGGDPLLIGYEKMTLCFGHACGIKVSDLIDDNDWRTLYRGLRKKGKSKPRRDLTRIKIHPI